MAVYKDGVPDKDTGIAFDKKRCYRCSDNITGYGIWWRGFPEIFLHSHCALGFINGISQDIHEISYRMIKDWERR